MTTHWSSAGRGPDAGPRHAAGGGGEIGRHGVELAAPLAAGSAGRLRELALGERVRFAHGAGRRVQRPVGGVAELRNRGLGGRRGGPRRGDHRLDVVAGPGCPGWLVRDGVAAGHRQRWGVAEHRGEPLLGRQRSVVVQIGPLAIAREQKSYQWSVATAMAASPGRASAARRVLASRSRARS